MTAAESSLEASTTLTAIIPTTPRPIATAIPTLLATSATKHTFVG